MSYLTAVGPLAGLYYKHVLYMLALEFICFTERLGRVVNIHVSYSGVPRFKILARTPALLTEVFMVFLSLSRQMPG
jgi:hypothetical protein